MSEEVVKGAVVVDGITANDENAFVSEAYQIALACKPMLESGDLDKWVFGFKMIEDEPIAAQRLRLFYAAISAGSIIIHTTDKVTKANMKNIDAIHAGWYGSRLITYYRRWTYIDPN